MQRTCVFALSLLAVPAAAQTLTPREMFYGQGRPAATPAKPVRPPDVVKPPPVKVKQEASAGALPIPDPDPNRVKIIKVADTIRPLGLKYSVQKRTEAGEYVQMEPGATFVNGDQIRLTVESNDTGYLYVVTQGTSKMWKPLFPSPEIAEGDNKVERGKRYNIPNDSVFSFSGAPGAEKLFVVLSRQPEGDIRSLMYKLQDRQRDSSAPAGSLLAANLDIQDSVIQRLRTTYARDLVIEKVDDTKKPPAKAPPAEVAASPEKAVYVVNARAGEKAWVVADIELRHE